MTTARRPRPSRLTGGPTPTCGPPKKRRNRRCVPHKLTVARAYAGRGLGVELLDWAGNRAAVNGAKWLRVDVWTTNSKLQQYYLDHGFTHVRTVVLPHNPSGASPRLREAPADVAARLRCG
jgi:GNAT superfamily N-acetyltransferase